GVHVAAEIALLPSRIAWLQVIFAVSVKSPLGRAHRSHVRKPVAALDAHVIRDRSEAVRGIQIAVAQSVLGAAPQPLAGVGEKFSAQVVDVSALAVQQLTKLASVNHAQDERLVVAVAAVLENHAMAACLLRGAHNLPA